MEEGEKDMKLWIDDQHLVPNYGAELKIYFDDNDKFWKFEAWGE